MGTRFQSTMAFDGVRLIQCTRLRTLVIIAAVTAAAIEDDAFQWHKDTWACSSTTPGRGDGCLGETGSAPGGIKKKAPPPAPGISSTLSTEEATEKPANKDSNAKSEVLGAKSSRRRRSGSRRRRSGSRRRRSGVGPTKIVFSEEEAKVLSAETQNVMRGRGCVDHPECHNRGWLKRTKDLYKKFTE